MTLTDAVPASRCGHHPHHLPATSPPFHQQSQMRLPAEVCPSAPHQLQLSQRRVRDAGPRRHSPCATARATTSCHDQPSSSSFTVRHLCSCRQTCPRPLHLSERGAAGTEPLQFTCREQTGARKIASVTMRLRLTMFGICEARAACGCAEMLERTACRSGAGWERGTGARPKLREWLGIGRRCVIGMGL